MWVACWWDGLLELAISRRTAFWLITQEQVRNKCLAHMAYIDTQLP